MIHSLNLINSFWWWWRQCEGCYRCPTFITPHPRQTDRAVSVSGHALMCCVCVWPREAPVSQSEDRRVTHWPIRGQDSADHDTDAVMRGEAVTRSQCQEWNTKYKYSIELSRRDADSGQLSDEENCVERMQRVDPTCQHREKHPIEREIYSACSRLFLRGYTHPTLIGITFCTFRTFCEIGSQWECLR